MSLSALLTQTLTVYRKTGSTRDAIGGETLTESTTLVDGYLEPMRRGGQEEDAVNRNTQLGDWIAIVPAETDVTGWDRIECGGLTYDITGPPAPMWNPRTSTYSHLELVLRVVGDATAPWVPS